MASRGKLTERNWRTSEGKSATIDDISVFVIPILDYKKEYSTWLKQTKASTEQLCANPTSINSSSAVIHDAQLTISGLSEESALTVGDLNGDDEIDTSAPLRLELR
jgi:hypothetical protein